LTNFAFKKQALAASQEPLQWKKCIWEKGIAQLTIDPIYCIHSLILGPYLQVKFPPGVILLSN